MARKKAAKKKKARAKVTRKKRGRPPGVAGMSVAQLEAAIARRKTAEAKKLKAKRAKLARDIAGLDKVIAALTGAAPKRGPGRPKKKVVRKKRRPGRPKKKVARKKRRPGRPKKKVAKKKAGRVRSTAAQVERVQNAILKALKSKSGGLLKVELAKAVRSRPQTLNTALKKLLATKKVGTKGVTRNMRYVPA